MDEMDEKYEKFAKEFEALCEEYASDDFDVKEVKKVCCDIIDNYGE